MNKRVQSLNLRNFSLPTTTDDSAGRGRFARMGHNSGLEYWLKIAHEGPDSSVENKKSPLDDQEKIKKTEESKIVKRSPPKPEFEQIIAGGHYKVTENWDKFWKLYCQRFIPAIDDIGRYLNQGVTVLQIQEDLVQVKFEAGFPEGWLPARVLQSTRDSKLIYPVPVKRSPISTAEKPKKQEMSKKLLKQLYEKKCELEALKIEHKVSQQNFDQALKDSQALNTRYQLRLHELESMLKEAKESDAVHAREKETLVCRLRIRSENLNAVERQKKELSKKLQLLQSSWVPKDIANIDSLLDGCDAPELFLAQEKIQAKIQLCLTTSRKLLADQEQLHKQEKLCIICCDNPKTHMFEPCKHFCACETCCQKILDCVPKQCPICRSGVVTSSRVYV